MNKFGKLVGQLQEHASGKVTEGKDKPGVRDGSGPYKKSYRGKKKMKGMRKAKGEKCPNENVDEKYYEKGDEFFVQGKKEARKGSIGKVKGYKVKFKERGTYPTVNGKEGWWVKVLESIQESEVNMTNDHSSIIGTSLQGYMPDGTTYADLVKVFGEPGGQTDGYKVDAEWVGTVDGMPFSIYNYKTGKSYLGDEGAEVEDITGDDWHIGGKGKDVAAKVVAYFQQKTGGTMESISEAKLSVDYFKEIKGGIKRAQDFNKAGKPAKAADEMDDVADDAADAAKALRKIDRNNGRAEEAKAAEEKKKLQEQDSLELDELREMLENIKQHLDEAVSAAQEASEQAETMGGEIARVVAGQLEGYLIGTLQNFMESTHQPGSIASLMEFIEDYEFSDEDEEEEEEYDEQEEIRRRREAGEDI